MPPNSRRLQVSLRHTRYTQKKPVQNFWLFLMMDWIRRSVLEEMAPPTQLRACGAFFALLTRLLSMQGTTLTPPNPLVDYFETSSVCENVSLSLPLNSNPSLKGG